MSASSSAPPRHSPGPGGAYPPPPVSGPGRLLRWGVSLSLALVGVAAVALGTFFPDLGPAPGWQLALEVVLTPAAALLVVWRRSHPLLVVIALGVLSLFSLGASAFIPWALVSLSTRRRWEEVLPAVAWLLVCQAVSAFLPWRITAPPTVPAEPAAPGDLLAWGAPAAMTVMWIAFCVGLGFYLGARRDLVASLVDRAETAEREQRLMVAAGKATERARIAREMHDVLAHRISLVSMHAGALAYRDDLSPEQTRQIAAIIQENAHASLTELRQVLGTLREASGPAPTVEAPQPSFTDLPALVHEEQRAGAHVTLVDEVDAPDSLPPPLARHAYRMVQEALTNARKHALGAPVRVGLSGRRGQALVLEIRNPLTRETGVPGARLGLVGLAERAEMVGGTFEAGPRDGDFVVRAWLPWEK